MVRAMQPWPVAYTYWRHGSRLHGVLLVHATTPVAGAGAAGTVLVADGDQLVVAAGEGAVRILTIQGEGKKPGPVADFLRGHHIAPGDGMGSAPAT